LADQSTFAPCALSFFLSSAKSVSFIAFPFFAAIAAARPAASPNARLTLDNIMYEDTMTGWVHLVPNSADVIIIQLGNNYQGGISPEEYQKAYRQMIEELRGSSAKTVICIGPWSNGKIEPYIAGAAQAAGAKFISLRAIAQDPGNLAAADRFYPKLAARPGNRGMKLIAEAVWNALSEKSSK